MVNIRSEHLQKTLITLIERVDLKKVCFILTGFGETSKTIQRFLFAIPEVTFFTAIDKKTASCFDIKRILNPLLVTDSSTNYAEEMIFIIKKRDGIIIYVEEDFIGRELSLLSKDCNIPLFVVDPSIVFLGNNKNISAKQVIEDPGRITMVVIEYLSHIRENQKRSRL